MTSTISPEVTTFNTSPDNPSSIPSADEQMALAVAQVFCASFLTATKFGGCTYAVAAKIAAEMVQAAIAETIEGRAS